MICLCPLQVLPILVLPCTEIDGTIPGRLADCVIAGKLATAKKVEVEPHFVGRLKSQRFI